LSEYFLVNSSKLYLEITSGKIENEGAELIVVSDAKDSESFLVLLSS
jgi:hypothetical protein